MNHFPCISSACLEMQSEGSLCGSRLHEKSLVPPVRILDVGQHPVCRKNKLVHQGCRKHNPAICNIFPEKAARARKTHLGGQFLKN